MFNRIPKKSKIILLFVVLFIFATIFIVPVNASASSPRNIPFNEYFTNVDSFGIASLNGESYNAVVSNVTFDSSYLSLYYPFDNNSYALELDLTVSDQYKNTPYHSYFKFVFPFDDDTKYYYNGGDYWGKFFTAHCTLVGGEIVQGTFNWDGTCTFTFGERFVQIERFYFSFPVYVTSNYSSVNWYVAGSSIVAMTDNEYNTNAILDNQNQNTDKILNGWESESNVDTESVDEHNELDNTISNNNQIGMNEAKDLFTNFSFNDGGSVYRGLLAVTNVFNKFSNIPLFSNILKYSLVTGLFAFVIGMTVFVAKKGGNK